MRMKESAETHEKARSYTYIKLPYMLACLVHFQLTDVYFGVWLFNKNDRKFAAVTTQPQCLQNVPTRLNHTRTKEEEG